MKRFFITGWLGLAFYAGSLQAQAVVPVPQFNLKQFAGVWYEVLRSPAKDPIKCASEPTVLYSLTDKPERFSTVRSCRAKGGFMDFHDEDGRLAVKGSSTGALKVRTLWPFWRRYDVVALGPDDAWAVLMAKNHRSAWVLARTASPDDATVALLKQKVTDLGVDATRMVALPYSGPASSGLTKP